MRIAVCASEVVPFAKTGGLADVAGALPLALERTGADVIVIMPRYKAVRSGKIEIKNKVTEDGKLFGSINVQRIIQILEEYGYKIDKSQIKLESPIKEVGEYDISIGFNHGLEAQIKLIVTADKEENESK